MGLRAEFCPCLSLIYGGRWLQIQSVLQDADDVRAIFIDPRPIVLANHVPVGMPNLLGYPVNSGRACSQQLTCVGVPALARPSITNQARAHANLEEPIAHNKVIINCTINSSCVP